MSELGTITVVGLGPAGADLMTTAAVDAVTASNRRFLRTTRHPAAAAVTDAVSFDEIYEAEPTFAAVYERIADELVTAAIDGDLVYAVPGSPLVLERTVELLLADDRATMQLVPGLSFVDLAWVRLGIDPFDAGVRLIDGHRFEAAAAGERGPLLVAHCHARSVLSDIKLAVDADPATEVVVLQRLGAIDEAVFTVPWAELDRSFETDHLTALFVPELASAAGSAFTRFDTLVGTLRRECPWDAEQTHQSLRRHLLEETYEVLDAIDGLDATVGTDGQAAAYHALGEELGDLLFQVCLHARLATEQGWFDVAEVCDRVHDKLHARHPHVFDDTDDPTVDDLTTRWEQTKRAEKGRSSVMDGIPDALPSSLYALKVQKKARSLGFGIDTAADARSDVVDELHEVSADPSEHEMGDLFFAAVGLARVLGHDPEMALRGATRRFEARFRLVERWAEAEGLDLTNAAAGEHGRLWARAKAELD
ncbi:MAG: nucleoside triphosphate pyrophosphohydrolase [Acidimicrobiia bacterium]|nr:nucleoside triphosphate pyrophosphohydrolase [Acidimicrobiia bacterium]